MGGSFKGNLGDYYPFHNQERKITPNSQWNLISISHLKRKQKKKLMP